MAKKPPSPDRAFTESVRRIKANRPTAYEGYEILDGFLKGHDGGIHSERAMVIICAALLEHALDDAISSHFIIRDQALIERLFRGNAEREAPLQSLYAKSYLAYALGVFGERTLKTINAVRELRNLCAHDTTHFSFEMKEIAAVRGLIPAARKNALLPADFPDPDLRTAFLIETMTLYVYLSDLDGDNKIKRYRHLKFPEFFS